MTSGIQSQHNELVAHARAVNLYKDLDETEHWADALAWSTS